MEKIFCFKCNFVGLADGDYCPECGSNHWVYEDEMADMVEYQTVDR